MTFEFENIREREEHNMESYTYKKNSDFISGTSYPEQFLFRSLAQILEAVNKTKEPEIGLEFDIIVPELNLRIEYSGEYWHKGREINDELKRVYCKSRAINYIEIIEKPGDFDSKVYTQNLYTKITIASGNNLEARNKKLLQVLNYILKRYGHSVNEIDIDRAIYEALAFCKKYKYTVVKRNGTIVGTENLLFEGDTDLIYGLTEEIEPYEKESETNVFGFEENVEETKKRAEETEEETDVTLVEDSHRSTMSDKRFRQHCKNVMNNWNNF